MADYISLEAAYKTLTEYYHHSSGVQHTVLREALNRVPSADVRPVVRGHWIEHISDLFPADSTIECDQCHAEQPTGIDDNFCPNCGADMREPNLDTTKGDNHD